MPQSGSPEISKYAALQSVTEIGLGSLVHGWHIPLGGHILALNQVVILTLAVRPQAFPGQSSDQKRASWVASSIAFVSALLKVLSPTGARLMPALAIAIQGILFSSGMLIFGWNVFGVVVGSIALSVWGFLQPLIFAYLFFGEPFFAGIVRLWVVLCQQMDWRVELGSWIIFVFLFIKTAAAAGLAIFAWRASPDEEEKYWVRIKKWSFLSKQSALKTKPIAARATRGEAMKRAVHLTVHDLTRPIFILSLIFSLGAVVLVNRSNPTSALLYLLKTVGVAALIFLSIHLFPRKWAEVLLQRFPLLGQTVQEIRDQEK